MKAIYYFLSLFFSFEMVSAQSGNSYSVYFKTDSSEITSEIKSKLDSVISKLKKPYSNYSVTIKGHTDNIGSKEYNTLLSDKRSRSVEEFLVDIGFMPEKINSKGLDFSSPASEKDRKANRRTEIYFLADPIGSPEKKVEEPLVKNLPALYKQLSKPSQSFVIRQNLDTIITCKEGTKIKIPQNAFYTNSGRPIDSVRLEVKEFYTNADILLQGLNTNSEGSLIETGGMVYINAMSGKDTLFVSTHLVIGISTKEKKEGMQVFYDDNHSDNTINWTQGRTPRCERFISQYFYAITDTGRIYLGVNECSCYKLASVIDTTVWKMSIGRGINDVSFKVVRAEGKFKNYALKKMSRQSPWSAEKGNFCFEGYHGKNKYPSYYTQYSKYFIKTILTQVHMDTNKRHELFLLKEYASDSSFCQKCDSFMLKEIEQGFLSGNSNDISNQHLSYYILKVNQLNWINCDRFINSPSSKVTYTVKNSDNADIKIVFKNIKSVLTGQDSKGNTVFPNVPINEVVTIVGIKIVNNKPYLALKETKISKTGFAGLDFKPTTISELKEKMKEL